MKYLASAALIVTAVAGCSSTPTTPAIGSTSQPSTTTTPAASATSTSAVGEVSSSPSTTTSDSTRTSDSATPTVTGTDAAESLGQEVGAKIAFYAIAKAAGMNESAKMDELAKGICSRIESGKPATVGAWMDDTFQLKGDVAGKVAIAAIVFECPKFKSLLGS